MKNFKFQISNLKSIAENCARQLRGWADSLQNSDIAGQRHLNNRVRRDYDQKQRAAAFVKKLRNTFRPIIPFAALARKKNAMRKLAAVAYPATGKQSPVALTLFYSI